MFNIGLKEIIIVLVILDLLFGAKRIPQLVRSVMDTVHEFNGLFRKSR